jgi:predicted enzyme related to lactoylglutathione lyase
MENNHIDYIEFKTNDIQKTKAFYHAVFLWSFTDFGSQYSAFTGSGVSGGFEVTKDPIRNGVLVVLYHKDLFEVRQKIIDAGGSISKETFSFPGGKRFHFLDPSGNELAVWSEE